MQNLTFAALVLGWITILLWGSKYIEWLWVRALGIRTFRFFVAPGIIVHEYSHAIACILTGAKIHEIKLFKRDGGHVKHDRPPASVLGIPRVSGRKSGEKKGFLRTSSISQFIISMAPVVGCLFCIWLLGFLGNMAADGAISPVTGDESAQSADDKSAAEVAANADDAGSFTVSLAGYVWTNFLGLVRPLTHWGVFGVLYLWLLLSFTVAMAPSERDFLNSIVGLVIMVVLLIVLSFAIAQSGNPETLTKVLTAMLPLVAYTLAVMGFALVVSMVFAPITRAITRGRR